MALFGKVVPAGLQAMGGPRYLVGLTSTNKATPEDQIEFGPMPEGAIAIKINSGMSGRWAIGAFTRQDTQDIIDGLTQILADNPDII